MKTLSTLFVLSLLVTSSAFATVYRIDKSVSKVEWIGEKVTGRHNGFLKVKSGQFKIENDKIKSGEVIIDMKSVTVADLEGKWADKLLAHLKSDDFFATKKFPEAKFKIDTASNLPGNETILKGKLTIKGKTHPATIAVKSLLKEGRLEGNGTLKFDRTKWGIKYNSGKFFESLGDKLIEDEVTVELNLVAKRV